MKKFLAIIAAGTFGLVLSSCTSIATVVNEGRRKRALQIAGDLRIHKESSKFYRKATKLVEIEKGIRLISHPKLEIWYTEWPLGPKNILDVNSGQWSFYD